MDEQTYQNAYPAPRPRPRATEISRQRPFLSLPVMGAMGIVEVDMDAVQVGGGLVWCSQTRAQQMPGEQGGRQTRFRWVDSLTAQTPFLRHRHSRHRAQTLSTPIMDIDPSGSGGWRFAQCFGDKGEVEDITEGAALSLSALIPHLLTLISRHYIHR